jgi:hypothetical protein
MSDITAAISADPLSQVFAQLVKLFRFDVQKSIGGSVQFNLHAAGHLERGNFSIEPPNPQNPIFPGGFFKITDVGVDWDTLSFGVAIDIPTVTIGGECIIDTPWGCAVRLPKLTFFESDPDVSAAIDIGGVLRSRLSLGVAPKTVRQWNGDAHTYQWTVVPHIVWSNIDLIDLAATAGDLIDGLIQRLIDEAFGFLPDWARDIVDAILQGIANLIRRLLSIPNDVVDWLDNLLRTSLTPFNLIVQLLEDFFENKLVIYAIDDPMEILAADAVNGLPAVKTPIAAFDVAVQADEATIGVTL